ncbi:YwgA family protein [Oceanobacillus bengalensis]|uniref:YwgA family protein n=1 Tax=Oceanobacillus bengalensis TaxID=1435466 RepID=A0A494YYV5_9BACI|nr:YwgA family protein [Oceanobacillus bengalensis]RKQ15413.1 YwgA family protein [Oceanobacillus bengalensis]
MLDNHAKIMQFFSVAQEVTGRKKMQKMIYILQKSGVPFEEKYNFHFYGPYSEELTLRIEELCNLGFLNEVKEDKSNYYQYNYTITDDGMRFLQQFSLDMPDYREKVDKLKMKSSRFLELVATMFFFDDLPIEETVEKVHTVKPKQKYSEEEINEAIQFIYQMKQ